MKARKSDIAIIIGILTVVVFAAYMIPKTQSFQPAPPTTMQSIYQQVVDDEVAKYDIVRRSGSSVELCVQAQIVVASYLQAQDDLNYQIWQSIKNKDCEAAGVPTFLK